MEGQSLHLYSCDIGTSDNEAATHRRNALANALLLAAYRAEGF